MSEDTITALLKVLFMILFFSIVSVVGTLPFRMKSYKSNPKFRIIGTTFAGALFINVAILHILPESANTLEDYLKGDDQDQQVFPLANLLLMVGFLITVFFTKIMTSHTHSHDHQQTHSHNQQTQQHSHNHQNENTDIIAAKSLLTNNDEQHQNQHQNQKEQTKKSNLNQAYVLTIAIYFHTIFEGIAIGVQTKLSEFLAIAIAIAFHKWADALSMGCHYKNRNVSKKIATILIIVQAILNVASIGLGWIISIQGDVVQAIFLSLSAGTFLAISTMQLLSEQFHHKQYKTLKYGLLVLATIFISAVWFVENRLF